MPLLSQASEVQASRIREIAQLADEHPGTLRLFYGEDTRPTPEPFIEAGRAALAARKTFYTPNAGYPSLRQAIADQYQKLHGLEINPADRVVVTASGAVALLLAVQSTLNPGDEAIVISPLWPNIQEMISVHGASPVHVPLVMDAQNQFQLNFEDIENAITPRTRLIALASPNNPTGWTASPADWRRLGEICRKHDLWLLADTVYDRLIYDESKIAAPCPLALAEIEDRLWIAQSFSKAYRMTGWRVGWLITPPGLVPVASKLQEYIVSHAAGFTQEAARFAMTNGETLIAEMRRDYTANRNLACQAIAGLPGLRLAAPPGAFYLFPKIDGLTDSFAFCARLVTEQKLGIAPGSAFGPGGEGHVRICFAVDQQTLLEALDRFKNFCLNR
jgi:aspartate/methionine/tyrosine aminotransferase